MDSQTRRSLLTGMAFLLPIALLGDVTAQAPDNDVPAENAGEEADHDALRELRAVAEKAINENDLELLRPYMAEEFSVVTYTDREFTDFDDFKERWQKTRDELLSGGSYTTKLNPELSQLFGDMAIARGRSDNVLITGDGTKYEFPSRWTAVLHKVDGEWKVVRAHSSISPFDNPMLTATVSRWLVIVGVIAAVIGVLVGGIFGLLIGRRKKRES